MAYTSCAAELAASIAQNCDQPLVGGYTGMGILIPAGSVSFVQDAENKRKIKSIVTEKVFVVDNVTATPFTGSTTAGNSDSGYPAFTKTLSVRVPMRGADTSRDVIEGLVSSPDGYVAVLAKKDKSADGAFEVVGFLQPLMGDVTTVSRDESANGGAWTINLTCTEAWAEVSLVGADGTYESAKEAFNELVAKAN